MGRVDERPMEDVVTPSRIGKYTGRRLHSDMSVVNARFGTSPKSHVRKTSCFWNTVLNSDAPVPQPLRQPSALHHNPRPRTRGAPTRPVPMDNRQQTHYYPQMFFQQHQQAPVIEPLAGYRCQICGAMFRSSTELSGHKQTKHVKQSRPHPCNRCELSFSQRSHLNQHVRTVHDKHKPFQCEKCEKSFGKRFDLTSHVDAVHDNERPHACQYCIKKFAKRSNLTRHVEKLHPRSGAAIPLQRR